MILVDSSAWIDYFSGTETAETSSLSFKELFVTCYPKKHPYSSSDTNSRNSSIDPTVGFGS